MRLIWVGVLLPVVWSCSGTMPIESGPASRAYQAPDRMISSYYLQQPASRTLNIKGQLAPLSAGGTPAAIMYPGNNAGGFLAAIAVHAAVNSSVKNAQEQNRIDRANQILESYQGLISEVSNEDLHEYVLSGHAGLDMRSTPEDTVSLYENGWLVTSEPMYTLSSSEDAIYIKNKVIIQDYFMLDNESKDASVYEKNITITSLNSARAYDHSVWLADNGEYFEKSLKHLYAQSIWLAVSDFQGNLPATSSRTSTIRYLENGEKKVERGKLINESCDQMLFETLRGELKVVQRIEMLDLKTCTPELFGI